MAVIPIYTTRQRSMAGPHRTRLEPERYYLILKAILAGYEKSSFYQQKTTKDPRPIFSLLVRLSGMGYEQVNTDMKAMVNSGLVRCCIDERKSVFVKSKKKKKPIRTYECTEQGLQFIADYDGNKIGWDWSKKET